MVEERKKRRKKKKKWLTEGRLNRAGEYRRGIKREEKKKKDEWPASGWR